MLRLFSEDTCPKKKIYLGKVAEDAGISFISQHINEL